MSLANQIVPRQAMVSSRQAIALPVYTIALILDFAAGAIARLTALVAGDDWP